MNKLFGQRVIDDSSVQSAGVQSIMCGTGIKDTQDMLNYRRKVNVNSRSKGSNAEQLLLLCKGSMEESQCKDRKKFTLLHNYIAGHTVSPRTLNPRRNIKAVS